MSDQHEDAADIAPEHTAVAEAAAPAAPASEGTAYSEISRDVWLLAIFRGISLLGDGLAMITLYLRVAPLGHAWAVAGLAIASSLPLVILAPVAGHVVDSVRAKPLLIATGVLETIVCAGLGVFQSVAATLILMFLLNVVVAFSMPGYTALLISISGEHVNRTMSVMQSSQGVASVAGPIFGGMLVGLTGQHVPLYIDAASFAFGTIGTILLRHDRRPEHAEGAPREPMTAGLKHLATDPILRPVAVNTFVFLLTLGAVNVAEVFFVTATLHSNAFAYGAVSAAFGLGTIGGAMVAGKLKTGQLELTRNFTIGIFVTAIMIGMVGLVANVGEIYPFMVIAGISVGIVNVAGTSLFAVRTVEAIRGRVFAALNATMLTAQISSTVVGGLILVLIAPRTVYQAAGVMGTTTALLFGIAAIRASRRELNAGAREVTEAA